MTLDNSLALTVLSTVVIVGAAWGDLRRQVNSDRELQNERHTENTKKLTDIASDVKRINGTVRVHGTELDMLQRHCPLLDRNPNPGGHG